MNVHHLELFFFVAKHGGISQAVRNMPYGIQQPAVSGQILQLEDYLGVTLFQRRPFSLTPEGRKLFRFVEPFFANLEAVTRELQGGTTRQIRVGASEVILRDHLPEMIRNLRGQFPGLRITLREGYQPDLERWLQKQEIDFALTVIERKAPPGIQSQPLLELPLVLLVPKESRFTNANQLWKRNRIEEPLVCLPGSETICRHFQEGLQKRGIGWFPAIEVSSLELIETYVANGFGIGLSVAMPDTRTPHPLRVLPLPGFQPVVVGALWRGKLSPVYQAFLGEIRRRAEHLSSKTAKAPATPDAPRARRPSRARK